MNISRLIDFRISGIPRDGSITQVRAEMGRNLASTCS